MTQKKQRMLYAKIFFYFLTNTLKGGIRMTVKKFCSLVVAGALSALVFACSNGTDSSDENRDEALTSSSSESGNPAENQESSSSDIPDSTNVESSSGTSSSDSFVWKSGDTITLSGYVNRGLVKLGSSVTLYELDESLEETGVKFSGIVFDSSGAYMVQDVVLSSPYVYIKLDHVEAEYLCDEGRTGVNVEALLDLRDGLDANLNILTTLQAWRTKVFVQKGINTTKARKQAYDELRSELMLDSLQSRFEQISMADTIKDNYYLMGVEALSTYISVVGHYKEDFFLKDELDLSDFWYVSYGWSNNHTCFKLDEHAKAWHYKVKLTKTKEYLKQIYDAKYDFGTCSAENYAEIKVPLYQKNDSAAQLHFCDSTHWVTVGKYNCWKLDEIILDTLPGKPGDMVKGFYCKDKSYKYTESDGWQTATELEAALGVCDTKTVGYKSSGRKCYACDANRWEEISLPKYDCDEILHECEEEDGKIFKGYFNQDSSYVCDGSKARRINEREKLFNTACVSTSEKKSFEVGLSTFNCEKGEWSLSSGDSAANALLDERDSRIYRTVGLGTQRWMAQELNYSDTVASANLAGNIYRVYQQYDKDTITFYSAAAKASDICPAGYHVPTQDEWNTLFQFADKYRLARNALVSLSSMKHNNIPYYSDILDEFGFSLNAYGFVNAQGKYTQDLAEVYLWAADSLDGQNVILHADRNSSEPKFITSSIEAHRVAIRCVEDREKE